MSNLLNKSIFLLLLTSLLTGCNPANYGWSDCDTKMTQMFDVMGTAPDNIDTTVERREPDGWSWNNDDYDDAEWFVTQYFSFTAQNQKKIYQLTFNSSGSACQMISSDII